VTQPSWIVERGVLAIHARLLVVEGSERFLRDHVRRVPDG